MNATVERLALRSRSWLMSHHHPSDTSPVRRLCNWATAGPRWRWLAAGPAVVAAVTVAVVWWVVAQVAGVGAILAGWSPPLTLAALDTLPPGPEPATTVPSVHEPVLPVDDDDPAAWNFNHDPWVRLQREQLALQREHLAELRLQRQARTAELAATRPEPAAQQPAASVPSYWWPPATPRRRRPVRVAHALVIVAVVAGLAWGIGAFSLGVASSAGWIRQPPAFTQLDTPQGTTP